MKALKLYAKYFKRKKAYGELCDALDKRVIAELKKCENGQAVADGVEFHLTTKSRTDYPKITKEMIESLKKSARDKDNVIVTTTPSFDAAIPKSVVKVVLAKAVAEFKKYFKVKTT